jgi:hypothetical protein
MRSTGEKWLIAFVAGILFALISLPFTYGLTNKLFEKIKISTTYHEDSNVTPAGLAIHTAVFILVFRLFLQFFSM